jgi:hypothetical protein
MGKTILSLTTTKKIIMNTWIITTLANKTQHTQEFFSESEQDFKLAVEACAEKTISVLKNNIQDDSLYLMFEWNPSSAHLTAVLTDASKQHDAPACVIASFPHLKAQLALLAPAEHEAHTNTHTELIKFWLYDYLTTSTAFFQYSLVAIFHSSARDNTELL